MNSVLIATFSPWKNGNRLPINGNLEPMRDYFVPRSKKVIIVDQPYPGSDFVFPRIEEYRNGKTHGVHTSSWWLRLLKPLLQHENTEGTHISFKIRDFFSVLDAVMQSNSVFDYFIGFESINALAGILMRRAGRIKKVVYYVSDYSPERYGNTLFNKIYLRLDRFCVKYSDYVWDVSPAMQPARVRAGLKIMVGTPIIVVPNGLYPEQIKKGIDSKIKQYSLVFLGTYGKENGPMLAIEALPKIIIEYPDVKLHMFGGPEYEEKELKKRAEMLHVTKNVVFHGFIGNREELSAMVRTFSVALAPYAAISSVRWYADATKIRQYFAAGLPVVTTRVPPLGAEAERLGAAIIVNDTPDGIADGVISLFKNKKLYISMRRSAFKFAINNTWNNEYTKAFQKMKVVS